MDWSHIVQWLKNHWLLKFRISIHQIKGKCKKSNNSNSMIDWERKVRIIVQVHPQRPVRWKSSNLLKALIRLPMMSILFSLLLMVTSHLKPRTVRIDFLLLVEELLNLGKIHWVSLRTDPLAREAQSKIHSSLIVLIPTLDHRKPTTQVKRVT